MEPPPAVILRQQAATLAIALLCEMDSSRPVGSGRLVGSSGIDCAYLREMVRASLIHWELSLRSDGRPADRKARRSALHPVTAWHVVQLLGETTGFETDLLLQDVDRHLQWLAHRSPQTPWVESALIGALADGAVLLSKPDLCTAARCRLQKLLVRQDVEGWFSEQGGADIGLLSFIVDSLGRLFRENEWGELEQPLQRALQFLTHFVHPDSSIGGCYGSCRTAFLSPYGVELLSTCFHEAADLAWLVREQCKRYDCNPFLVAHDEFDTLICARINLAAMIARRDAPPSRVDPGARRGTIHFPRAGLTIVATDAYHAVVNGRNGGALRVQWRKTACHLDDAGVTVIHPHSLLTSMEENSCASTHHSDRTVTSSGFLHRAGAVQRTWWSWLKRFAQRSALTGQVASPPPSGPEAHHARYQSLTHDRYRREVTFGDEWIRIHDHVHCLLPCKTVICSSPLPGTTPNYGNEREVGHPLFIEGGRDIHITRTYRDGELIDSPDAASLRKTAGRIPPLR